MSDLELKKQIQELVKAKEGTRTPRWLYRFFANFPGLWRINRLLPPPPSQSAPYHVIHKDPLIITIPEDVYEYPKQWKPFFDTLQGKKVYFLCRIRYTVEDASVLRIMDYYYNRWMKEHYPEFRFIFLANTILEYELLKDRRLEAIFCNQNCFVDENLYYPYEITRQYDAVYNARPIPLKNFNLAKKVSSLALITYFTSNIEKLFFERLKQELPDAIALNFNGKKLALCDIRDYEYLPPDQISKELCRAYVGLCLSEREGANYASIEYLLSGLPVVSVPSIGGRDVFFDSKYCFIVEKNPDAVRDAVLQAKSMSISPQEIRQTTLEKINQHRRRFIALLQEILDENGKNISGEEVFKIAFINRMYRTQPVQNIETLIELGE